MAAGIRAAAKELPIVIAGAGPAGAATAIGLNRLDDAVRVFEARGPVATRARNLFLRPQAREILEELTGRNPGRDTTIMAVENSLRNVARNEGVDIAYNTRVVDIVDRVDHVDVSIQRAGSDAVEVVPARMFVDASGGRLAATNVGDLERVPTGPSHVYVTAQYDTPPPHSKVFGAFDRDNDEAIWFLPISDSQGFVSYYDLPVGVGIQDEAALLARYDALAGQLQLGTPISPPQAFDAMQHVSKSAASGHVLKLGDSAGNADPYIGAGVAAALVDARNAVKALSAPGDATVLARQAADDVLAGHKSLGAQAGFLRDVRDLGLRLLPRATLDETLRREDLGASTGLDLITRFVTSLPVRG